MALLMFLAFCRDDKMNIDLSFNALNDGCFPHRTRLVRTNFDMDIVLFENRTFYNTPPISRFHKTCVVYEAQISKNSINVLIVLLFGFDFGNHD